MAPAGRWTCRSSPRGPVASQEAIKLLGTNGGGYFGGNSAHPFENPTPLSNGLEMVAMLAIPLPLPVAFSALVRRRLREWTQVPIIVLSVRGQESDKIQALDCGADDYLTKPFGIGELLARLRAALRRVARAPDDPVVAVGDLVIDLARRRVTVGGREVRLTGTEYALLRTLALHAGKVLTHAQLLRAVWGPGYERESHLLRVNMSNLRRKVEPDPLKPRYLITEPGVGYRLREAADSAEP